MSLLLEDKINTYNTCMPHWSVKSVYTEDLMPENITEWMIYNEFCCFSLRLSKCSFRYYPLSPLFP